MVNIEVTNEDQNIQFESEDSINFTQIYNSVIRNPKFTPEDFRVYSVICSYTWGNGSWNLTVETLIEQTTVKRTTLFSCLNWLEENGYIKRVLRKNEKGRLPNKFIVKKVNPETGLPVGVETIEIRKPVPKKKKAVQGEVIHSDCVQNVDNSVDNIETNQENNIVNSLAELTPVRQPNLPSSPAELTPVRQLNRLNTIVINTIVKDDREKDYTNSSPLSISDIWEKSKRVIKEQLTEVSYKTWIEESIKSFKVEDGQLVLGVVNDFSKGILENKYADIIKNTYYKITKKKFNIKFESNQS